MHDVLFEQVPRENKADKYLEMDDLHEKNPTQCTGMKEVSLNLKKEKRVVSHEFITAGSVHGPESRKKGD